MDYLVEFIITIPDDAPPAEIEQRLAGETTRVAELASQGHVLRVWKPLPEDGPQRALGPEVEYADLRGTELSQARPDLPDRPLRATNPVVRDLPSVKRIYEQEAHAIAPVSVDIESRGTVMAAADLTFEVGRYEPRVPLR